jgi:Nucleotidyl transferase AbiEii toxin, Type IV TA system
MLTIDDVILKVLVGIYSNDILSEKLYLKGGQALRVTQDIKERFSVDSDFSISEKIDDEKSFFNILEAAIKNEFHKDGYFLIDFKPTRKPERKPDGVPDFWQGWAVEFKLITKEQLKLPAARQSATAIVPEGTQTNKISIDISEYEYCGSFEKVKVKSVEVRVYTKILLLLEKLRAICQSHPGYKYRSKKSNRARDFYDIEQVYSKVLKEGDIEDFFVQCAEHLANVFAAKEVPLDLIDRCLNEKEFLDVQLIGWEEVKATVRSLDQDFSYYLQTLKDIVRQIREKSK